MFSTEPIRKALIFCWNILQTQDAFCLSIFVFWFPETTMWLFLNESAIRPKQPRQPDGLLRIDLPSLSPFWRIRKTLCQKGTLE